MTFASPITSAEAALDRGDPEGALLLLRAVPQNPEILTAISTVLRAQGRLRDAVLHCDKAIGIDQAYAPAWLERGFVLAAGGSMDAAEACYLRVIALDDGNAAALAGLASIAARKGDAPGTRDFAERALEIEPSNSIATCAIATVEIEGRDYDKAASRLKTLLAETALSGFDLVTSSGLLGDALDGQGMTGEAFAAYSRSKSEFARINDTKFTAGRLTHREFVERASAGLARVDPGQWAIPVDGAISGSAANHIFLLGYPRSGTTLVENILASLPDVVALEERPTLGAADGEFLAEADGMARLAILDARSARVFREAYWEKVAAAGAPVVGKVFVDMDPLKGLRLPIISRLFPQAKILVMRRDPRDIVWSCFHTNFALTSVAFEFTTLERTARHYDAMMHLMQASFDTLPLSQHVVRYDALVSDFDGVTRDLCAFAGLPWSPALRNFSRTANARGVSTASASQVRKTLYDGTRQWERYRDYMEPILPILQPWVERFGFER
jgi:tetratricopeptide (TPR) repeat protein